VTRLASVRSIEGAHRTAIAVAAEVFPRYHCVVGVRDGEWVEPIATSSGVSIDDCNRVRVGRGSAGTAIDTGDPVIESRTIGEAPYDALLSLPVGDETVLQLAADEDDGFDAGDRRLAELLASHVEETLDRIRADEALRTERDHLLALFSNVPDPAIAYDYVDGEPIVHRVNDAFEETFAYDADRVVGESVDDYIVPPSDEAEAEAVELNERLQCGENVRREVTRETADGLRHFILHVVPIRLDAENVSGYAIYTDVTERREREAALRRQNERLDEFASIVSHDLRNPLSVAEGYVTLANETGEIAHLEKTLEALDRMDELVGDLLSLARQGEAVGETEPVSIEAIARDAWESVDTDGIELVVDGDVTIDASPTRTRELLENVFRNSVEHGRRSSGGNDGGDGAEEDNTRAVTHGAYADQSNLYSQVFDDVERQVADDIFADYRDRYEAIHGDLIYGHRVRLFKISVNAVTEIRVENWVTQKPEDLESGTTWIDEETRIKTTQDRVVEETKYKKSPALAAKKTLSNENRKWLKDLDLLGADEINVDVSGEVDHNHEHGLDEATEQIIDDLADDLKA
jgi:PAS domain S-box-containing protein